VRNVLPLSDARLRTGVEKAKRTDETLGIDFQALFGREGVELILRLARH
jgi:hypothetical protein